MINRTLIFMAGVVMLVVGITLVLRNFDAIVIVISAFIPPVLAVAGLVLMFFAGIKK